MEPPVQEQPIQTFPSPTRVPLSEEDQHWVESLRGEIWKDDWGIDRGRRIKVLRQSRPLTHEEWQHLKDLIVRYTLPCEMVNCGMGFQIGMRVYNHSPMIGIAPEPLLLLQERHLPSEEDHCAQAGWDFAFATLSPLTHSEVNKQILHYYRMDPPRSQSHYEY